MTPADIIREAERRGLKLSPRGDRLAVNPSERLTPEFREVLLRHKAELMSYLEGKAAGVPADCLPWLHVAKQVLCGEFTGADKSTRESIMIGLRGIRHPLTARAMERLEGKGQTT